MSSMSTCDTCHAEYDPEFVHQCNLGPRLDDLESRLAELEEAPRPIVAYAVMARAVRADGAPCEREAGIWLSAEKALAWGKKRCAELRQGPGVRPDVVWEPLVTPVLVTRIDGALRLVEIGKIVVLSDEDPR